MVSNPTIASLYGPYLRELHAGDERHAVSADRKQRAAPAMLRPVALAGPNAATRAAKAAGQKHSKLRILASFVILLMSFATNFADFASHGYSYRC